MGGIIRHAAHTPPLIPPQFLSEASEVGSGADAPLERSGFGAFSQFAFAYLWLNHDPGVKAEAEPSTRVLLEAICGDLMNSELL